MAKNNPTECLDSGGSGTPDGKVVRPDSYVPAIPVYSADELRAMNLAELVSHTVRLQQVYHQLESDNRFLNWEFQEFRESYTYFSHAAKLAHKLSAADVDTVADLAVREIPLYFNCHFAALFFFDNETGRLHLYRATGETPPVGSIRCESDREHFLVKLFFSQAVPFIVKYGGEREVAVADTDKKISAVIPGAWFSLLGERAMVFPLRVKPHDRREELVLGGLIIGDARGALGAKESEISVVFADLLSTSLYNARLVKRLNELTIRDPLTNLYNRRHLINQLGAAMIQARRIGNELSIAMLDIDHFKRINDTYGHLIGDKVLSKVAEILRNSIRAEIDIPARYGGEEFIIIMPFTGRDDAMRAAERLRSLIKERVFDFDGVQLDVTCSIGVASYTKNESLERFLDRADLAMYEAKENGRDQVRQAPDPPCL